MGGSSYHLYTTSSFQNYVFTGGKTAEGVSNHHKWVVLDEND